MWENGIAVAYSFTVVDKWMGRLTDTQTARLTCYTACGQKKTNS